MTGCRLLTSMIHTLPDTFELAKQQMSSLDTKWHYGYNSLYFIFVKLPLFGLFIPFLSILKLTNSGQILYSEWTLKRKIIPIHCNTEFAISKTETFYIF